LLLFATDKNAIPFTLSTFSHFETELHDETLISFQLDLFLRSLSTKKGSKRTSASKPSQVVITDTDELAPARFGSALEENVAFMIKHVGGRVTIPTYTGGAYTPDLLMWLPQQDKELFNPAAIEVKGLIRMDMLPTIQARLAAFVRSSSMGCGLIVVDSINVEESLAAIRPIPYTFVIGLREFKSKLENAELASWLKRERNRLVHGVR
jgi:hypothetical protein